MDQTLYQHISTSIYLVSTLITYYLHTNYYYYKITSISLTKCRFCVIRGQIGIMVEELFVPELHAKSELLAPYQIHMVHIIYLIIIRGIQYRACAYISFNLRMCIVFIGNNSTLIAIKRKSLRNSNG